MSGGLEGEAGGFAAPPAVPAGGARAERDALYWTELELRRVGNLVAGLLHARVYAGAGASAAADRARLRTLLDAMRRKALRVLHRAELLSRDPAKPWPGIDPAVHDPVALADEYVAAVQRYEAAFADAESAARADRPNGARAPAAAAAAAAPARPPAADDDDDDDPFAPGPDEGAWEAADARAYRAALAAARAEDAPADAARTALLGGERAAGAELRQRRGNGSVGAGAAGARLSAADEALLARHQPVQDQLSADLADIVGRLKGSVSGIGEKIRADDKVLDATADAVDANLAGLGRQRGELAAFETASRVGWWRLLAIVLVVLAVFVGVFLLIKLPI